MSVCRGSTSGIATLEFALVAPVFLLLTGNIINFARLDWIKISLQYAVNKAVRCAAINQNLCAVPAPTGGFTPTAPWRTAATAGPMFVRDRSRSA